MKIILTESQLKRLTFDEFANKRMGGAQKIANTAKEKGGLALLTWHHFKVKDSYYKKASEGKFNKEESIKEFNETYKKISINMSQIEFQRECDEDGCRIIVDRITLFIGGHAVNMPSKLYNRVYTLAHEYACDIDPFDI